MTTTRSVEVAARAFEPAAFGAVLVREMTLFRRSWRSTTFAAVVEPTVYLLAFGFGLGAVIATLDGIPYVQFVGTGTVATAVLFSSAFGSMFDTYVKRYYMHTYDALLSAPVDVHEVVAAEAVWFGTKAAVYGCAPLVVSVAFGLPPSWGMLLVPAVGLVTGIAFALFGIWMSAIVPSIDAFSYITSAVLTPLLLVAGTFFPISQLPQWAKVLSQLNPLYHCVELVRHCVFGLRPLADLYHLGALLTFGALMAWFAVKRMRAKLIS